MKFGIGLEEALKGGANAEAMAAENGECERSPEESQGQASEEISVEVGKVRMRGIEPSKNILTPKLR